MKSIEWASGVGAVAVDMVQMIRETKLAVIANANQIEDVEVSRVIADTTGNYGALFVLRAEFVAFRKDGMAVNGEMRWFLERADATGFRWEAFELVFE
jgi:hypothetical protein